MSTINATQVNGFPRPVDLIDIAQRQSAPGTKTTPDKASFKQMFSAELAQSKNITITKHAHDRLHSRGLELTDQRLDDLSGAIDRAQSKGSKETLVLTDDAAFVVSVENRAVITVFDRQNLRDGVVTSIDSAVII
ncbi:MAG: TIGR02530 family flagellar biosynthesis protein [bacterium]